MDTHTHSGNDGSSFIYNTPIRLKPGNHFHTGMVSFEEPYNVQNSTEVASAGLVVGDDQTTDDGLNTAQFLLTFRNDQASNVTSASGPIYSGTDAVVSGTSVSTTSFNFVTNELAGMILIVVDSSNNSEGAAIVSNTTNTITVDNAFTITGAGNSFLVFNPVYLGFSTSPWKRAYVMEGTDGGIRFGLGTTNNGQNGLLYMGANGKLYWRGKGGTAYEVDLVGD